MSKKKLKVYFELLMNVGCTSRLTLDVQHLWAALI